MTFTCTFCALLAGVKARRTIGKCKLTPDNIAGAGVVLKQLWPAHIDAVVRVRVVRAHRPLLPLRTLLHV